MLLLFQIAIKFDHPEPISMRITYFCTMFSMMIVLMLFPAAYYLQLNTAHYAKHIDTVDDIVDLVKQGTHTLIARRSSEIMNFIKNLQPENGPLYLINENINQYVILVIFV